MAMPKLGVDVLAEIVPVLYPQWSLVGNIKNPQAVLEGGKPLYKRMKFLSKIYVWRENWLVAHGLKESKGGEDISGSQGPTNPDAQGDRSNDNPNNETTDEEENQSKEPIRNQPPDNSKHPNLDDETSDEDNEGTGGLHEMLASNAPTDVPI